MARRECREALRQVYFKDEIEVLLDELKEGKVKGLSCQFLQGYHHDTPVEIDRILHEARPLRRNDMQKINAKPVVYNGCEFRSTIKVS